MSGIQKRSAVIVGVSSYQDGLTALPNTKNDAERLAQVLTERCQFDSNRVYLLIGNSEKGAEFAPTKPNILAKIEYLINSSSDNEIILFFFAGHGAEVSGTPYLVTEDTRMNVLDQTAIDVTQLNTRLEKSTAQFTIRIFDACRNNFGTGRTLLKGMTPELQATLLKRVKGWATLSACSSDQFAHEDTDTEHGIFSRFLCEGLEGKAEDNSGCVTLEGLVAYVKGAMDVWCNQRTKEQQPQFQLDISGQLIFSQITSSKSEVAPLSSREYSPVTPMKYLMSELDNHLLQISSDVRELKITSSEISDQMAQLVYASLKSDLAIIHAGLNLSLGNVKQTDIKRTPPWSDAYNLAATTKVVQEWQDGRIIKVSFNSSQVAIPSSVLYIAVVRFTFFYWIWWELVCERNSLERDYNPTPLKITDYRTFAPSAALEETKIRSVIDVMLAQVSEQILQWAKQLAVFLDKTVEPVRQWKDIIK